MKKLKAAAFFISAMAAMSLFSACEQIGDSTTAELDTSSTVSETEKTPDESNTSAKQDVSSGAASNADELSSVIGFSVYEINNDAYKPVSYDVAEEKIAQITYNHDGNTAVLRIADSSLESSSISGINGTENAEVYEIPEYDLSIDIQENDNKFIAEWEGTDKNGELRTFSIVEENVDIAVFENTVSQFAKNAMGTQDGETSDSDQSDETSQTSESGASSEDTSESEDGGEVIATFENNLETYQFKVEKDGSYEFTDPVSDVNTAWDIYVLDEPFEDGLRYLMSNFDPQGSTPCTLDLKEGQYVYCFCTNNAWTIGEKVDCRLTIKLLN